MAYDIIIVAGQSNAEGVGAGDEGMAFQENERILELRDIQPHGYAPGPDGKDVLMVKRPWDLRLQTARETGTPIVRANFGLYFAEEYLRRGYLAEGRKILLIRCGVGGTGFSRPEWGEGNVMEECLYDMIAYALKEKDSKVVAFLWHQGEHDAFENAHFTPEQRQAFYYEKLGSFVARTRKRFDIPKVPFIAGEFVHEWWDTNVENCNAILRATREVCEADGYAGVASSEGLQSNNERHGDEDVIHFCRFACKEFGLRYFEIFENIRRK
jgi:hypothetical protein